MITASVVVSVTILLAIIFGYFYWGDLSLADENSITENVQAQCCAFAAAAFGYAACIASMPLYFRFFVIFFAELSFSFILREIDI
ncbi:hypothetical protein N9V90_03215, partial [Endozoicomonas sp.]|nr:hypothetical protein [Endozoicomonas sp.]